MDRHDCDAVYIAYGTLGLTLVGVAVLFGFVLPGIRRMDALTIRRGAAFCFTLGILKIGGGAAALALGSHHYVCEETHYYFVAIPCMVRRPALTAHRVAPNRLPSSHVVFAAAVWSDVDRAGDPVQVVGG